MVKGLEANWARTGNLGRPTQWWLAKPPEQACKAAGDLSGNLES